MDRTERDLETASICQKYCPYCKKYKSISEMKEKCEVRKAREKFIKRKLCN